MVEIIFEQLKKKKGKKDLIKKCRKSICINVNKHILLVKNY